MPWLGLASLSFALCEMVKDGAATMNESLTHLGTYDSKGNSHVLERVISPPHSFAFIISAFSR